MGGTNEIPINKDIDLEGNLNIYICGDINGNENEKIIHKIFPIFDNNYSGFIKLTNNESNIYKNGKYFYEYRKLNDSIDTIDNYKQSIIYNAYIFIQKVDKNFSHILIHHLYEMDSHNKRKNVILCFNSEKYIKESINDLKNISRESIPLLIFINKKNYDEQLKYENNINDLESIKSHIKNTNPNENERRIYLQSEKTLINLIKQKLNRINAYYNEMGYKIKMFNPNISRNEGKYLSIALVGYSGTGKSTFINLLFNELVAKTNSTSIDVTTLCSEYYLPQKIRNKNIRFLDFPGITEESNYKRVVEYEINRKYNNYRERNETINCALYFISNGVGRELTTSGKKLVHLLYRKGIKIIFVINGQINQFLFEEKKNKIKNAFQNDRIVKKDKSNIINTNYYLYFDHEVRDGIDNIIEKIFQYI